MVTDAIASNWIAPLGPHVDAFENEMRARLGVPHALALSSGTAALHLALLVAGVQAGDHVWCSTLTFAASANAIAYCGAVPVFIDSDLRSWNLDPQLVVEGLGHAAATGTLPKALIAVDLYGQCADLAPIAAACKQHGVVLIEDAAEALGATYRGQAAGSFGDLAILSFNGNKIISTSGGGMLVGHNSEWLARARYLATQAREPVRHYEHKAIGYNYRLSNLLAAVGRAQLGDLDRRVARRRAINARYRAGLAVPGVTFMPEADFGTSTFWLTCATIAPEAFGATRDAVIDALAAAGIEARPVWKPLHLQPVFATAPVLGLEASHARAPLAPKNGGAAPVSETLFRDGICLPSGSGLSDAAIDEVIAIVQGCARGGR